ncbi:NUDIX hydrolase [Streptomyces sp. NPDC020845]|uniref:NUDIX hydrolase n=1 Tax=Streptomyces sp. NPDC020845 TaxID=3365096 RepID=UPI00379C998F
MRRPRCATAAAGTGARPQSSLPLSATASRRPSSAPVIAAPDGKVLLHRSADDYVGSLWELPADGVDTCESLIEALRGKVAEETGLTVAPIDEFVGHFDYLPRSGKQPDAVTADAASTTHPAHGSRTRPEY